MAHQGGVGPRDIAREPVILVVGGGANEIPATRIVARAVARRSARPSLRTPEAEAVEPVAGAIRQAWAILRAATLPSPGSGGPGIAVAVPGDGEALVLACGAVAAFRLADGRLEPLAADPSSRLKGWPPLHAWSGALRPGDALLLVSRALATTLGLDELRSAVLTLGPTVASAHLRRLFRLVGGRGSDAVAIVEWAPPRSPAVEVRRTAAIPTAATPWPAAPSARHAPGAAPGPRAAALGLLSFAGVVVSVALVVLLGPRGGERVAAGGTGPRAALETITDRLVRAENMVRSRPDEALALFREALWAMEGSSAVRGAADAAGLSARVRSGLDALHGARAPEVRAIATFAGDVDPGDLARDRSGALYVISRAGDSVLRVDPDDGDIDEVVHRGDEPARGDGRVGRPTRIDGIGSGVLIVDDDGRAWTWRPSDDRRGTLAAVEPYGDAAWPVEAGPIATRPDPNGFRLYVVDPAERNILRFQPMLDGQTFTRSEYLVSDDDAVSRVRDLHVDETLYTLLEDGVRRYRSGRLEHFAVGTPPDATDLRPGFDPRLLEGTSGRSGGELLVFDAAWDRVLVFDTADGRYLRQWAAGPDDPSMSDMRGFVIDGDDRRRPDTLYWVTPAGISSATLEGRVEEGDVRAADARAVRTG